MKWIVLEGEVEQSVFSEALKSVEILDEGEGECISQKIRISPKEWPELMNAINHAIKMCQKMLK